MFRLSLTSMKRMVGVHPLVVLVVNRALQLSSIDFMVGRDGGLRETERQKQLIADGVSKTMDSYHLPQETGMSHAIDLWALVEGKVPWNDLEPFKHIRDCVIQACDELEVPHPVWGGDWDSDGDSSDHGFIDAPHFEWHNLEVWK